MQIVAAAVSGDWRMTPAARVAAAIAVLDSIREGTPAEQALTRWARQSRYAGSGDRAAVRDHVFDALRRRRSAAVLGGGDSGRALMLGVLRQVGEPVGELFSGFGHAPEPLSAAEAGVPLRPLTDGEAWNLPDWLIPEFTRSLGADAAPTALGLQERAPVTLRVNLGRTSVIEAQSTLRSQGIETRINPLAETALTVTAGSTKLRNCDAYRDGWVELQDAGSQAVTAGLPSGVRVLDYCAGGGGKALALAADGTRQVFAHDINPRRMQDLHVRAARSGARITHLETAALDAAAPFDLVLCDAPCSGSGSWRRSPEGKWSLTQQRLSDLNAIQDSILRDAARLVSSVGQLVYATCSVLMSENEDRIAGFLALGPDWVCTARRRIPVNSDGDGFFVAHLTRGQGSSYSTKG